MATAKKTTTTKAATRTTAAKASTTAKKETVVEVTETAPETVTEEIVEEKKPIKVKKAFTDSDYILCRSVTSGGLNIVSQSGNLYDFRDYGEECEINYRDLVTLIRRGSEHVFLPRFIILDEDFLEDFPTVKKVYGEMYTMNDLVQILELPISQMQREIAKLPEDIKNNMRNLITTQIANGKLDSIAKVRTLSEIFDSDFNLLSELFVK